MPDGDESFRLPFQSQFLPPEFVQSQFDVLDEMLKRVEQRQVQDILGQQEDRGFFRSGQTPKRLVEEVLGPGLQRRREALIPLAARATELGRDERLGELGFQRQRQFSGEEFERKRKFAQEDFLRQLDILSRQQQFQKELLQLQDDLSGGGFGDIFTKNFAAGLGKTVSGAVGGLASKGTEKLGNLF